MKRFKEWLSNRSYKESTIAGHLQRLEYIEKWSVSKSYELESLSYKELTEYVECLREQVSVGVIKNRINTLKQYYTYLTSEGMPNNEGIYQIQLQDKSPFLGSILNEETLESLYDRCISKTKTGRFKDSWERTTILAGFVIYQGLDFRSVSRLEVKDIDFDSCEMYIKSSDRSNARKLILQTKQLMRLYKITEGKTGRLYEEQKLRQWWNQMSKMLRKLEPRLSDVNQLRKSVLANWTERYNIRQVQYMAGHKLVKSTERYKIVNVEKLKKELVNYHPFGVKRKQ